MIGVICPSVFEYKALKGLRFGRHQARLVVSGMGKLRALYACHRLTVEHPRLRAIALVGYAGGLSGLKIGDLVEPKLFIEQDYCAEPFEKFPNIIKRRGSRLLSGSVDGVMLTQDRFLKENPYRNDRHLAGYRRVACDMESYAVAYFCRQARIRCGIAKYVSDTADARADHDFLKACKDLSPRLRETAARLVSRLTLSR